MTAEAFVSTVPPREIDLRVVSVAREDTADREVSVEVSAEIEEDPGTLETRLWC